MKLRGGHLVIDLVGIAPLNAVHRGLRQRGLEVHDGFGIGRGLLRRLAQQLEHVGHVLDVLVAQFDRLRVCLQVVVAVGKAQATLVGAGDLHHRILGVRLGAEVEQHVDAVAVQTRRSAPAAATCPVSAAMRSIIGFSGAVPLASMPASSMQE